MKKNKQTETTCSVGVIASNSGVTGCKGGVTGGNKDCKKVVTECCEGVLGM